MSDTTRSAAPDEIILVAFQINGLTRAEAMELLSSRLGNVARFPRPVAGDPVRIEAWWVAEDDRTDGSEGDSAVFVPRGAQSDAEALLNDWAEANYDLWSEEGYPYADTDVSGSWFRDGVVEDDGQLELFEDQ